MTLTAMQLTGDVKKDLTTLLKLYSIMPVNSGKVTQNCVNGSVAEIEATAVTRIR